MNASAEKDIGLPLSYKILLNLECNLSCKMCMLWGQKGWCKKGFEDFPKELEWRLLSKIIDGMDNSPRLIISGGEPMIYSKFSKLMEKIKVKKLHSIVCTNGTLTEKHLDCLLDNPYVSLLISLDGLKKENDIIRGEGTYEIVTKNIRKIKKQNKPPYIGVQFTIMPDNVHIMHDYCKAMVDLGVDWIVFNLCWFISPDEASNYEDQMMKNFNNNPRTHKGYVFDYEMDVLEFEKQMKKIRQHKWPVQISSNLFSSMQDYIGGKDLENWKHCYKQFIRLDIMADGKVYPCIQFPDYDVGDLNTDSVSTIWNSEKYKEFRKNLSLKQLPTCKKCDVAYLYNPNRRTL